MAREGWWSGRVLALVAALSLAVLTTSFQAQAAPATTEANWSQYHYSVDHRGVNRFETILSPSTVPGLHEIWAAQTGGAIYSSPAVVDGVVYVGSSDDYLYAFDATTGTELWSAFLNGAVFSSPAVANGAVYVGSSVGLFALDASTGSELWEQPLGVLGVGAPPTVFKGVVYAPGETTAYALDGQTGAILWNTQLSSAPSSAMTLYRGRVFVGTKKLYALDASNGALLWMKSVLPDNFYESTPAAVGGLVYAGSSLTATAFAFRASTGRIAWRSTVGPGNLDSSPAVDQGRVFLSNYSDNSLWALDARTGSVAWSAAGGGSSSGPAVANGVVYCGSKDGSLYAFDEASGALLWSGVLGASVTTSSPAVVNGMVFVGSSDGTLHAFGL